MDVCIFCKIIKREIPANIIYETESLVVFPDISPAAEIHLLIVPKQHIGGLQDIKTEHGDLLAQVYSAVNKLVIDNNLKDSPYRVAVNGGKAQHVPHLHFHLLGGQWKKMI